jgi:integrase
MAKPRKVQTKSGKEVWEIVYDEPSLDGSRRQRRRRFGSYKEANNFLKSATRDISDGIYVEPSKMTLHQLWQRFMAGCSLKPGSVYTYNKAYRSYIMPKLGSVPAQALTTDRIQRLLNEMSEAGYAPNMIQTTRIALSSCYRHAMEWKLVKTNPVTGVKVPGAKRGLPITRDKFWSSSQLKEFFDGVEGHDHYLLYFLMANTGIRPGEALALQWGDIDLERKTLSIRRTQARTRDGKRAIGDPKTASSVRTILLGDHVVDAIKRHRSRTRQWFLRRGRVSGREWVFPSEKFTGLPVTGKCASWRFNKEVKRLGLPPITLHGLRHSAATAMMERGVPAKVVQEILGHSSIATTLGVYSHVTQQLQQQAANALASLWKDEEVG